MRQDERASRFLVCPSKNISSGNSGEQHKRGRVSESEGREEEGWLDQGEVDRSICLSHDRTGGRGGAAGGRLMPRPGLYDFIMVQTQAGFQREDFQMSEGELEKG